MSYNHNKLTFYPQYVEHLRSHEDGEDVRRQETNCSFVRLSKEEDIRLGRD